MTRISELEPFVDATVDKLLERIDREIARSATETDDATAPLLVNECMSFFAADAIGEIAVSHDTARFVTKSQSRATISSVKRSGS